MANSLGTNPIFIDGNGAGLPLTLWIGKVKIDHIVWAGYSDATHRVTFTDTDGVQIWDSLGHLDLSAVDSGHMIGWVNGLKISARGSGQVMIYHASA